VLSCVATLVAVTTASEIAAPWGFGNLTVHSGIADLRARNNGSGHNHHTERKEKPSFEHSGTGGPALSTTSRMSTISFLRKTATLLPLSPKCQAPIQH
jgi:hypothetical protein